MTDELMILQALDRVGTPLCQEAAVVIRALLIKLRKLEDEVSRLQG